MLGTLWLATTLYNFNQTPYLQVRLVLVTWQSLNVDCCYSQANKRELLADYALPVAVLSFSFIGSVVFDKVSLEQFDATEVDKQNLTFKMISHATYISYFDVTMF